MKVLMLVDDLWHPAEVIQRGLATLDAKDLTLDYVCTAKDILTETFVQQYDVVVNCKGNSVNAANSAPWFEDGVTEFGPEAFLRYVESGGGLVVVHSGLTVASGNRPLPDYTDLVGSYFLSHPPREEVSVHIMHRHPITEGVEDFCERDEHYQLAYTQEIEPLMESTSAHGGTNISGYVRHVGQGRVVVLAPGHTLAVWENPQFRKLFTNAIHWCKPSVE